MFGRIARSPSKTLLVLLGSFVLGVAAHAWDERRWADPLLVATTACAALPFGVLSRKPAVRLMVAAAALAALGVARYDAASPSRPAFPSAPPAGNARFEGTVAEEPRESLRGTVLVMDRVVAAGGGAGERAVLSFRGPTEVLPGDRLSWTCRMRANDRSTSRVTAPWSCFPAGQPMVLRTSSRTAANGVLGFKRALRSLSGGMLPEPDSSLLLGLLIGDRGGLPPDLVADFRATGTSHVLAVSGYNVHQVVECAFVLLALLAVDRRRASWAVAGVLAAFVALTGGDAPVVRAAIMGGMGLAAGLVGRRNAGPGPLAVAAALMLALDPTALRHDVGFRLSFAAVAGMRAFGPVLAPRLRFLPEAFGVRSSAADTLAATAGTLPVALHDFGLLPVAAPLVNVAVAPFVPLIMGAGCATLVLGAVAAPLGAPPALATLALSRAFTGIVRASAAVAPVIEARASAAEAAALYAGLGLLWFGLSRPAPPPRAAPTDAGTRVVTYGP